MTILRPTIAPIVDPLRDAFAAGDLLDRDAGGAVPLSAAISAILGANAIRMYDAFDTSRFDSLSAIGSWSPSIGSGAATQASAGAKPSWSGTAINGRPGVTVTTTGDDLLATSSINLSSYRTIALTIVAVSTNGAIHVPASFGAGTDNGNAVIVAREVASRIEGQGRAGGTSAISRAASAPYTSASVITVTVDYDLTTHCVEIRKNGAVVTSTYDTDTNLSAGSPGNLALYILNRSAADLGIIGSVGACLLSAWTTAVPASLALAEQELMRRWAIA